MFCDKCGAKLNDDSKFCNQCGVEINAMENSSSNEAPKESGKKKGKKGLVLCFVAVVVLVVVLIAAIGGNQDSSVTDGGTSDDQNDAVQATVTTEKEEVDIETIHMTKENMRPVILETSKIKVRFNKFDYANGKTVFGVNFIVENDTSDDISVVLTDVKVNGFDISTSTGKTLVEPGHKSNCDSSVWQKEIDKTGTSEWNVMEGVIEIRDGYWGDALYSVPVIIDKACWEYQEEYAENNPITPVESSDIKEIPDGAIVISSDNLYPVLVEEEGVSAAVSGYGYANGKTVFKLNFTFENNTAEDLSIVLTDVIVDGYDISTSTGTSRVEAGHKAVCDSSIWLKEMKEVGINDWVVLTGVVKIRKGYGSDALYSVPVVIYRNAWTSIS